ncbi:homoserine kinase [Desulfovibrio inopinatus]|uniref:homoserine kinase n=1 Tax=Desulfovibrio inopinatus TaxID=102109 RepID=UPI0003F82E9E|nr:homoserine kinase [Desulfovibrio inopinatus]
MTELQTKITENMASISLIGMAGAGKSTLARLLAEASGWAYLDTDRLIEATYGMSLGQLLKKDGLDDFLKIEESVVCDLFVYRSIIATGGSVIYSQKAMEHLRRLGKLVYLKIDLETFRERLGDVDARAFIKPNGLTLEDVYTERTPLYEKAADIIIETDKQAPETCLAMLKDQLSL